MWAITQLHTTTWMNREDITIGERGQTQKTSQCVIPLARCPG